jgi:GNAT superfamily N-acetyltransferase
MEPAKLLSLPNDDAVRACHEVFRHLRLNLPLEQFARQIETQYGEGYRIVYLEDGGRVAAAAGFRVAHFLAWGKVLYVDDLITQPGMTGRGLGGRLMEWLIAHAAALGCDQLHLDTGYYRQAAHRLYLRKGLQLGAHHLWMAIGDSTSR